MRTKKKSCKSKRFLDELQIVCFAVLNVSVKDRKKMVL